jgi:cell division initiation protein
MKIAPIDIAHKTFGKKMMGFDPVEVTHFLKGIAEELESLVKERNQMREALREREMAIIEYRDRDELLKNTITTATKMADKIQVDADREAKLIINDANQKAEVIIRDARESLKKIYGEISDLKRIRMQFENNLRALMQSHLAMIEQGHKIMPNPLEIRTQLVPETIEPEKESIKASIERVVQQKAADRF